MLLHPDYTFSFVDGNFEWVQERSHDYCIKRRLEAPVFAFHNTYFTYPYL